MTDTVEVENLDCCEMRRAARGGAPGGKPRAGGAPPPPPPAPPPPPPPGFFKRGPGAFFPPRPRPPRGAPARRRSPQVFYRAGRESFSPGVSALRARRTWAKKTPDPSACSRPGHLLAPRAHRFPTPPPDHDTGP